MPGRHNALPLYLENGKAVGLHRVPAEDKSYDEDWVQELLHSNPSLLPTGALMPAASEPIAVGREIWAGEAGPVDVLYVNSDGVLTLVETKLWRNPQARREVVAQLIHYASALAKLDYDQLADAIRDATGIKSNDPMGDMAKGMSETFDRVGFQEAVSRNLRQGRFLLLIVGDRIGDDVERMTEYLQSAPQLSFSMGLIELGIYRTREGKNDRLIVVPNVIARTVEVVRAVVEVRNTAANADVSVTIPIPPADEGASARNKMTEGVFLERLGENAGRDAVEDAKWIIDNAPRHQIQVKWNKASFALYYTEPESGDSFSFGHIDESGEIPIYFLPEQCRREGLPDHVWKYYYDGLLALIPRSQIVTSNSKSGARWDQVLVEGKDHPGLSELGARKQEWFNLIVRTMRLITEEMAKLP